MFFCTFFDETGNGAVAAGTSTHRRHLLGRFLVRFSKKTCFKLLQAVPSMAISVAESSPEVFGPRCLFRSFVCSCLPAKVWNCKTHKRKILQRVHFIDCSFWFAGL